MPERIQPRVFSAAGSSQTALIVFEPTLDDTVLDRLGDTHRFLDAVIEDLPAMVFVKDGETRRRASR